MAANSASISLLQLPQELILLICDHLYEPDLMKLCRVSSLAKTLSLLAILARYDIFESQLRSQELTVPSGALWALSACYPTVLPTIRALDVRFSHIDGAHRPTWRSVQRLAVHFPPIPRVKLTFAGQYLDDALQRALVALVGDNSRPVIIMQPQMTPVIVRPSLADIGFLERAWRISTCSAAFPVIDKQNLGQKIQSVLAGVSPAIPYIQVRTFTDPKARLGSLVVLNPAAIFDLEINSDVDGLSLGEWQFILPDLHLRCLRELCIQADVEYRLLSDFLDRHPLIDHIEFSTDWSCMHPSALPPFCPSALPLLKHLSGGPRTITHILQTANEFPHLNSVYITTHNSISTDPDRCWNHVEAALRAIAARSSVTSLTIHVNGVEPPWRTFEASTHQELANIQQLEILPWTHEAEYDAFSNWLARFPALNSLRVPGSASEPNPLVSESFVDAIQGTYPHIIVDQQSVETNPMYFLS